MFVVPCQKRRHIIRKERDGSKGEFYRCAHRGASTYSKEVDPSVCEKCAVTQPLLSFNPCASRPPTKATYRLPNVGDGGELRYEAQEGTSYPPCPTGYQRRDDDPWTFDSIWFECQYRVFNNDVMPDGSLKVNSYCMASGKPVNFDECERCQGDVADVGASLTTSVPNMPGITSQVQTYWIAVQNWIAAGRPTRTDKEVEDLHNRFCSRCDWYDPMSKRCKGCGCKVKPGGTALLNKIRMKTEHCPREFW